METSSCVHWEFELTKTVKKLLRGVVEYKVPFFRMDHIKRYLGAYKGATRHQLIFKKFLLMKDYCEKIITHFEISNLILTDNRASEKSYN